MAEYQKPWLPILEQIERLAERGVDVGDRDVTASILNAVGYYRLTGYLYPFRVSEWVAGPDGHDALVILDSYQAGTSIAAAAALIDFDRQLRMLVLDGTERIEVSLRTSVGHILGEVSAYAHEDPANFGPSFTAQDTDPQTGDRLPSKLDHWIERVEQRQNSSDEAFVKHFRERYDGRMPIWALTEIMEFGHLARLYSGLNNPLATRIAQWYGVPSKRVMSSWIASLNYVRNVAAHHARLFNRKLVTAPKRSPRGGIPLLDHLSEHDSAKARFGVYNALAVMAYLIGVIDPDCDWRGRVAELILDFPSSGLLSTEAMGVPADWNKLDLWQ
ncbi:Abi family protein [Kribbella sp. NPDC023855]|uniref:Abi family protein n=1 Tax=Kribbella sp. NPDC023855 TaxID=3154698 RepID=UPI0033E32CCF